jgi:recombination protein RecR
MYSFPLSLRKLIREIGKMPSIGEKSATRLAYHLVYRNRELAETLANALKEAVDSVHLCSKCFALTDQSVCSICADPSREQGVLCVVEKPIDVLTIERTGEYKGVYHVLHGLWAPTRGREPSELKIEELLIRANSGKIREVIFATGATVEGDATALFVANELADVAGIAVTRLAQGIPKGGEVEYADEITLARAFSGRGTL